MDFKWKETREELRRKSKTKGKKTTTKIWTTSKYAGSTAAAREIRGHARKKLQNNFRISSFTLL